MTKYALVVLLIELLLALASTLWARAEFHLGSSEPNTWKRFVVSKTDIDPGRARRSQPG